MNLDHDLEELQARFKAFPRVVDKVDEAAHSRIGEIILGAVKDIVPLLPDGSEIEALLAEFSRCAIVAHALLTNAEIASAKAEEAANAVDPIANPGTAVNEAAPATAPETPAGDELPPPETTPVPEPATTAAPGPEVDPAPGEPLPVPETAPEEPPAAPEPDEAESAPEADPAAPGDAQAV